MDGIMNEMLKAGATFLISPLLKLFNQILLNGNFPEQWKINTLTPLHKKGDSQDPKNYRGIAVASSLSKLFLTVLHLRLKKFTKNNSLIPNCQIAYKENCRTSDHILCLKNLIDRYISKATR